MSTFALKSRLECLLQKLKLLISGIPAWFTWTRSWKPSLCIPPSTTPHPNSWLQSWGHSSLVKCLYNMSKTVDPLPSTTSINKKIKLPTFTAPLKPGRTCVCYFLWYYHFLHQNIIFLLLLWSKIIMNAEKSFVSLICLIAEKLEARKTSVDSESKSKSNWNPSLLFIQERCDKPGSNGHCSWWDTAEEWRAYIIYALEGGIVVWN